jgi:ABC-type multidrug transport system fused ATPase/permease subunit
MAVHRLLNRAVCFHRWRDARTTAALDAETEHLLFDRYVEAIRQQCDGGITILVSHRFSTVRMAGLIVVLDGSRLAQVGVTTS